MALTDMVIMKGEDYQAICDAIRTTTGETKLLKSGDISPTLGVLYMKAELLDAGGAYPADEYTDMYKTAVIPEDATYVSLDVLDNFPNIETVIINGNCEFEIFTEYDSSAKVNVNKIFITKSNKISKLVINNRNTVPLRFLTSNRSIKELVINNMPTIERYAFYGGLGLEKIILNNVEDIGDYAFYAYDSNSYYSFLGLGIIIPPTATIENGNSSYFIYPYFNTIYGESGSAAENSVASGNTFERIEFDGNKKYIYLNAEKLNAGGEYFVHFDDFEKVIIPEEATFIDAEFLRGFPNVKTIVVNGNCEFETVTVSTGKMSFTLNGITNSRIPFTKIEIYNRDIVSNGFCREIFSLKEAIIGEGVSTIDSYAFYNCKNLENLIIGNNVSTIGSYTFYGCESLENLIIGNSVSTIDAYAFYGCSNLASVVIPEGVTTIPSGCFGQCTNLKAITIPVSVTSVIGSPTPKSTIPSTATIRGYTGSYAEEFASTNGYTFEAIG